MTSPMHDKALQVHINCATEALYLQYILRPFWPTRFEGYNASYIIVHSASSKQWTWHHVHQIKLLWSTGQCGQKSVDMHIVTHVVYTTAVSCSCCWNLPLQLSFKWTKPSYKLITASSNGLKIVTYTRSDMNWLQLADMHMYNMEHSCSIPAHRYHTCKAMWCNSLHILYAYMQCTADLQTTHNNWCSTFHFT